MFFAHSKKYDCDLHISQVNDFSDTFTCLNPNCNAEFTVSSINSQSRAAHFQRLRSHQHVKGCPYDFSSNEYIESSNLVKSSLDDILNCPQKHNNIKSVGNYTSNVQCNNGLTTKTYIRTANQLLRYCQSNSLDTVYEDGLQIKDFFVNRCTVDKYKSNSDVSGIKLLLGETYLYNKREKCFQMLVSRYKGESLEAWLYVDFDQFAKIKKYIFDTFGSFGGHSIAVLGNWHFDCKDNIIKTVIAKHSNVVYKFIHDR